MQQRTVQEGSTNKTLTNKLYIKDAKTSKNTFFKYAHGCIEMHNIKNNYLHTKISLTNYTKSNQHHKKRIL